MPLINLGTAIATKWKLRFCIVTKSPFSSNSSDVGYLSLYMIPKQCT